MGKVLDWLKQIIKNLFSIKGNVWVRRKSTSGLNLENLNGVAQEDSATKTCDLCVALNGTVFKNNNKPNYYHMFCKCINFVYDYKGAIIDFPYAKVEKYLFVNENKLAMMKTMGYKTEDIDEVYKLIYNIAKEKFDNGDYVLGDLNEYGQHFRIYFKLKGKRDCLGREFNCHIGCVAWSNAKIKIATPLLKDEK